MASPIKLLSRLCASVVTIAILFFHPGAFAFPLANEIRPYGEGVFANGYGRRGNDPSVLYTETYLDEPMNNIIRAAYWDGNRNPISYKELVFGADPIVPELFETIDYRRKRGYRITVNNGIANVKSIRVAADGSETVRRSTDVKIDSYTVIDASFHRYVLGGWDRLLAGKSVKINFLQVDRARLIPLKIRKIKCKSRDNTCFRISFNNFLLQALVPSIYMEYESNSKRLLRFNGIGPITQMNGAAMPVDIMYEYMQ